MTMLNGKDLSDFITERVQAMSNKERASEVTRQLSGISEDFERSDTINADEQESKETIDLFDQADTGEGASVTR